MWYILMTFVGEMQRIAFRLMLSSCVSMCVCVCVCVFVVFVNARKIVWIETSFFKLRGITPDIICKSLTQIGLQIPRWQTKWRPRNAIICCILEYCISQHDSFCADLSFYSYHSTTSLYCLSKQKHVRVKMDVEPNSKSRFQNYEILINVLRPVQAFSIIFL